MEKQNMRHKTWYKDINQIQETKNQIQEHNTKNTNSKSWQCNSAGEVAGAERVGRTLQVMHAYVPWAFN